MAEFFQGWRWKAGCAMLAVSLACAMGWIRSLYLADSIMCSTMQFSSALGLVTLEWFDESAATGIGFEWYSNPLAAPISSMPMPFASASGVPTSMVTPLTTESDAAIQPIAFVDDADAEPLGAPVRVVGESPPGPSDAGLFSDPQDFTSPFTWYWAWGGFCIAERGDYRATQVAFPYWSVTIPLTLLSAFLILKRPRKRPEPSRQPEQASTARS